MVMRSCKRLGCGSRRDLLWPQINIWPKSYQVDLPVQMYFRELLTCSECREAIGIDDLLGDQGREMIVLTFASVSLGDPDWESMEMVWSPIPDESPSIIV